MGIMMKSNGEEVEGRMGSLMNSLIPSAIGWSRPKGPTMLGPLRDCMQLRTFRSTRVRKATAIRIGMAYKRDIMR